MLNTKAFEDVIAFGAKYQEAVTASAEAAKAGVEQFSKAYAEASTVAFQNAVEASKKAASLKSPQDLYKAQAEYATAAFDKAVADSKALTDLSVKVANDVAQPLADHAKATWEAAQKAV